jgi:hypothetical protein
LAPTALTFDTGRFSGRLDCGSSQPAKEFGTPWGRCVKPYHSVPNSIFKGMSLGFLRPSGKGVARGGAVGMLAAAVDPGPRAEEAIGPPGQRQGIRLLLKGPGESGISVRSVTCPLRSVVCPYPTFHSPLGLICCLFNDEGGNNQSNLIALYRLGHLSVQFHKLVKYLFGIVHFILQNSSAFFTHHLLQCPQPLQHTHNSPTHS